MPRGERMTMFLVEFPDRVMSWCQISKDPKTGDSIWVDFKGRGIPYGEGRPINHMEVAHPNETLRVAEVFADIIRRSAETHLLRPDSDQGWVAPDGAFFGCGFYNHDDMAHAFFQCHVSSLEMEGYARVHADSYQHSRHSDLELTKAQRRTLEALGFYEGRAGFSSRIPERDRKPLPKSVTYVPGGRVAAPPPGDADARQDARRAAWAVERERRKAERAAPEGSSPPKP